MGRGVRTDAPSQAWAKNRVHGLMANELYQILGVAKTATQDQIKDAYRTLVKQHHPDRGGDEAEFKRIAGAYQILGDAEHRREYDLTGQTKIFDTRQAKKAKIMEKVINQKAKEYVLSPLQKLIEYEQMFNPAKDGLKQKIAEVEADIKKLDKSRKAGEITTVLGMLVSIRNSFELKLKEAKLEHELCRELIKEFDKACRILNREPEEVVGYVEMDYDSSTASTTGGY